MLQLQNDTKFAAELYTGINADNQEQQSLVIKQSFEYDKMGKFKPAYEDIIDTDEYINKPGHSSISAASEIVPYKQGGEILLTGKAYPNCNTSIMEASIKIIKQDQLHWQKTLRIFGQRFWKKSLFGIMASKPQQLNPIDLVYENAYGGADPTHTEKNYADNPIGKGFSTNGRNLIGKELPQIELASKFISRSTDKPQSGGFGPLPHDWAPRLQEQGDIGDAKTNSQAQNASPACHNVAPVDQRFEQCFSGGEKILLKGLSEELSATEELTLELPHRSFHSQLIIGNEVREINPVFDTVIIDSEQKKLHCLYRTGILWPSDNKQNGWVFLISK